MPDIFNHTQVLGGAYSADSATVTFGNYGAGFLAQSLRITYAQEVGRVYELGSNRVYLVSGRSNGTGQIMRLIGPAPLMEGFYEQFGDVCEAGNNNMSISFRASCQAETTTITLHNVVLSEFSLGIESPQNMLISAACGFVFVSCTF